ncbi:unnamed protein product [Blepharisma stoltei]|uniref:RING-type domain-containing protein n=1 Tax=Blepharisma stoltei TaxID=1481888 RepID=A0AAU9JUU6_9CILI|nr:unnamed protein product [Blepharisma stoltei]
MENYEETIVICDLCGFSMLESQLLSHGCSRPQNYQCDFCHQMLSAESTINHQNECPALNQILNRREDNEQCSICRRQISSTELQDHLYAHSLERGEIQGSGNQGYKDIMLPIDEIANNASQEDSQHPVINLFGAIKDRIRQGVGIINNLPIRIVDSEAPVQRPNLELRRNDPILNVQPRNQPRQHPLIAPLEQPPGRVNLPYHRIGLQRPSSGPGARPRQIPVNNQGANLVNNQRESLPVSQFKGSGESTSCTICMEDFQIGVGIKSLPCFHQYHTECIDLWLERHNNCPICKANVFSDN